MKRLLILWHSRTGGSAAIAETAAKSAEQEVRVTRLRAEDAQPAHLLDADGFVFVCPENLGSMTGEMKAMFDRCYYPVLGQREGLPYAIMICAGSDGSGAARQIERIATGWRLRLIADPLIVCTHAQSETEILEEKRLSPEDVARCEELGAQFAAGLSMGIY